MFVCTSIALIGVFLFLVLDASFGAAKLKAILLRAYNRWYLYLTAVGLTILIFTLLPPPSESERRFKAYKIPSSSMQPVLFPGDRLVANMKIYRKEKPRRGDVIVFEYPKDRSKDFVKRIVGLEDEQVEIIHNKIYINGESMRDSWGYYENSSVEGYGQAVENFGPVVVPKGSVFVLGDNRRVGIDSRSFGSIELAKIKGKALYIYWAKKLNRIGTQVK